MPQGIIIIGGVAGGMSAATRLRRLDESAIITVFEQGAYTGFANCGITYALGKVIEHDEELILRTPDDFKHVRTGGDDCIRQFGYDKLILAQGAKALRPSCAGTELDNIATMQTIADLQKVHDLLSHYHAKHICVIGAGFIGIEVAENLRRLGLDVSIVEYGSHVFPPIDGEMAEILHSEVRNNGIQLFLNESAQKIDKSQVILSSGCVLPADLVILTAGVRARTGLARQAGLVLGATGVSVNTHMQTSDPDIYAVGDMVETQNNIMVKPAMLALAGPANRQGRMAADHICGKAVNYHGNVGTSVCRVFGLTLGFVGLSTQVLALNAWKIYRQDEDGKPLQLVEVVQGCRGLIIWGENDRSFRIRSPLLGDYLKREVFGTDYDKRWVTASPRYLSSEIFANGACISQLSSRRGSIESYQQAAEANLFENETSYDELEEYHERWHCFTTGYSPLHLAALPSAPAYLIDVLVAFGEDLEARDCLRRTALHLAAETEGDISIMESLVEAGANVFAKDDDAGDTPLVNAVIHGGPASVKFLLGNGAEISKLNDGILKQCRQENPDVAVYLQELGIDVLAADESEAEDLNSNQV
ncbi:Arylesterase [Fusarium oxysporum f. sp. albedinis]|nr:Arylesterase [Fusarium oxysporum f. sp. albedinis]